MAATDYAGLARRLAPAMVAKLDEREALNKRLEGSSIPTGTPATPDETWRMSGGVQTRYNKARGGIETIENVQGTVKSGFTPYTPPAVSKDRPFADLLLTDIPKRMELVSRKLANGDIPGAQAERDRIEEFVRDNATDLHAFTRYTGDHPVVSAAAKQSLDLVTGGWLSDEQKLMFDPKLNPKSVQGWAARTGASPRLAEVMAAAQSGDETANAVLRAAGSDFRTSVMAPADSGGSTPRRAAGQPGDMATSPVNLDSFVRFSDSAIPAITTGLPTDAVTPDDAASMSRRLFTASSGMHPAAVGALAKTLSGVTPTDAPDAIRAKLSAGVDAASTIAGVVAKATPYAQSFLPAVSSAISSLKGGSDRVLATKDKLGDAIQRTMAAVDTSVAAGATVSNEDVARLTRVEYARSVSDVSFLTKDEQALSAKLQDIDALERGLTISLDPTVPAPQAQTVDRGTGAVVQSQAPGDLVYPGLASVKNAMMDVQTAARADLAFGRAGDAKSALLRHKDRIASELVSPPGKPQAASAAADMMLRYWASEGQFDLRTSYEDMYRKHHVEINKASVEDTAEKLKTGDAAKVYAAADKVAAADGEAGFDAQLYRFFSGRDPVNGKEVSEAGKLPIEGWDFKPGSQQWNKAVDFMRTLGGNLVGVATKPTSTMGAVLAGMPIGRIMDEKQSAAVASELATAISSDMARLAPKMIQSTDDRLPKAVDAFAKHLLANVRYNAEARAQVGQPDKTFGMAFPTEAEFAKVTAGGSVPDLGESAELGHVTFGKSSLANALAAMYLGKATGSDVSYRPPMSPTGLAFTAKAASEMFDLESMWIKNSMPDSPIAGAILSAIPRGAATVLRGVSQAEPLQTGTMVTSAPDVGLGRKMRDYTVSLFGAPQAPAPAQPARPAQAQPTPAAQATVTTLADLADPVRRAAMGERVSLTPAQQEMLDGLSPDTVERLRESGRAAAGMIGGDIVDWTLTGDELASGMQAWEATANRAKAPVEDMAVRAALAEIRGSSPEVSHYVDTMIATSGGALNRIAVRKHIIDARRLAAVAEMARKTMAATKLEVTKAKLRDLAKKRAGDEEGGGGMSDDEFYGALDAIETDAASDAAKSGAL